MSPDYERPLEIAFIEARDSASHQFADYLAGWRPKNPDSEQRRIIALIESMSDAQKEDCRVLVRHFTERALFKLIATLEEGVPGGNFTLTSHSEKSEVAVHISDDVDRDLIHAFWRWMAK